MLVYALACDGGLNVPGSEHARPLDFAEALLRRGATFVGSIGWAYGYTDALAYQELLMADFTQALVAGDGASVDNALVRTKQDYFLTHPLDHFDVKTPARTILYGLPMVHVQVTGNLPATVSAYAAATSVVQPVVSRTADEIWSAEGNTRLHRNSTYYFDEDGNSFQLTSTLEGLYYTYLGQPPYATTRESIQSKAVQGEANLGGKIVEPHDVVFRDGDFREVHFTAQVGRASLAAATTGWSPPLLVDLQRLERTDGVGTILFGSRWAQLIFYLGQYHPASGTQRLCKTVTVDEYFSDSPDFSAPSIESIDTRVTTRNSRVRAG